MTTYSAFARESYRNLKPQLISLMGLFLSITVSHALLLPWRQAVFSGGFTLAFSALLGFGAFRTGKSAFLERHHRAAGALASLLSVALQLTWLGRYPELSIQTPQLAGVLIFCGLYSFSLAWTILLLLGTDIAYVTLLGAGLPVVHVDEAAVVLLGVNILALILYFSRRGIIIQIEQAAKTARSSEERYRRLAEAAREGILVQQQGVILEANAALEQMFQLSSRELIGLQLSTLTDTQPVPDGPSIEATARRKDGAPFPVEMTARTVSLEQAPAVVILVRDLSERREADRKIAEQQQILTYSAKMSALGEMAGGIAHEINNPLSIIVGHAQYFEKQAELEPESVTPEMIRQFAQKILNTAFRMARTVRSLRTFAREGLNDPSEHAHLTSILDDTLELCANRMRIASVEIRTDVNPPDLALECRPAQLSQVLLNLLQNAYDAIHEAPDRWIRIQAELQDGHVVIRVSDSGPGIPLELRDKIMQPFFTTKEVGKGTGLGLSISKGLVEAHHGSLCLDPLAKHTTFVIRLPRTQAT